MRYPYSFGKICTLACNAIFAAVSEAAYIVIHNLYRVAHNLFPGVHSLYQQWSRSDLGIILKLKSMRISSHVHFWKLVTICRNGSQNCEIATIFYRFRCFSTGPVLEPRWFKFTKIVNSTVLKCFRPFLPHYWGFCPSFHDSNAALPQNPINAHVIPFFAQMAAVYRNGDQFSNRNKHSDPQWF